WVCFFIVVVFFISAPNVFHLGTKEKVIVQMGGQYLNKRISVYLKDTFGNLMSAKKETECKTESEIQMVELMSWSQIKEKFQNVPPHLDLVAEVLDGGPMKIARVLVSNQRGYIFIQTDQPVYNPTQKVNYRIFTLNHMFRPHQESICISVFNAAGNRIMKNLISAVGGIYQGHFEIPDISEMGTFKITAHYEEDEANAAVREFKVQKFVLPSFEVGIETERRYLLLNDQQLKFTISAMYSYGEEVKGAYHCQFGVMKKAAAQKAPDIISGLELTGSVLNGRATATLQLKDIDWKQLNQTLSDLQESGSQLYVGVFVTNIQNGEIQKGEIYLPIVPHKYSIDLSRTRSHFIPGFPLDVVVVVRHPDGTPAVGVPVNISANTGIGEPFWQGSTNQDGGLYSTFNVISTHPIKVDVSADGLQKRKILRPASSPSGSYLYISITNKVYHVDEFFSVTFNTKNGPNKGYIYYMVLSRGMIKKSDSLPFGVSVKHNLLITADMVPSFRLVGYYHDETGHIIADSVWVDVRDECEIKVTVKHERQPKPATITNLELDLHKQTAKVALLAVDKAFYGLKADNKLTAKQIFSTMTSYDLGCTYSGGSDPAAVLMDAGLAFTSPKMKADRRSFWCESEKLRQRRSVDLNEAKRKMSKFSEFEDVDLQSCCIHAFSNIPMRESTCKIRSNRVGLVKGNQTCADAFLKCCLAAEKLRQKQMLEDAQSGLGRTAITADMEKFFSGTTNVRRYFPPSFEFKEFLVIDKKSHSLMLPDSITTWEIQVVTLSPETGLCVVKPHEIRAFKESFVSLRLPYSVKKFEQLSISPVIYNYGERDLRVAVHMEQTKGLCSPVSATTSSYSEITVKNASSQFVSFSVVPMVTGSLPIKIRLYDVENEMGIDALEKNLKVQTEGIVFREEKTKTFNLDGRSSQTIYIDGSLPDGTVPDSSSNIFVSMEGNGFGGSYVKSLLSPQKVGKLIVLPYGCLEQTMGRLAPTTLAIRYLDLSDQWFDLDPGARDDALDKIESGYMRILSFNKSDGSYETFGSQSTSNWVTALVIKILSLVAELQTVGKGEQARSFKVVPHDKINRPVSYLLSVQQSDGSFRDPNPVLHRDVLTGDDQHASMTAFITLALIRSRRFLTPENQNKMNASILTATNYLQEQYDKLRHTYAMAITAYCLSVYLPQGAGGRLNAWTKLQSRAIKDKNNCFFWANEIEDSQKAITIETTAYALLTALQNGDIEWANKTACWLVSQENYNGGYQSTQDTIMALEALSQYELNKTSTVTEVTAEFTTPARNEIVRLNLTNHKEKVETNLQKLTGNNITVELKGQGEIKFKTSKAYHLLDPEDDCSKLNISVKVEGKVKYTAKITDSYDYYDDDYDAPGEKQARVARSAIERFDTFTRSRRDLDNDLNSDNLVTFTVCVSYSPNSPLTGMGIADITLLSGFEVDVEDLDREMSVNLLFECISFSANQTVPVGLLQPAPATFYDYYEPDVKCTVFYSPPRRSKLVSKLCSEDVCQCAERPCHKVQETFKLNQGKRITKAMRMDHACFFPRVDFAYIVDVQEVTLKSNFELYKTKVTEILRLYGDLHVANNSVRVFAKRLQCKGQLDLGRQYLIMGKDGATKDLDGNMQYLLESNTWVEKRPSEQECAKSVNRRRCAEFNDFVEEYKTDGCRQ
uniref:Complement C4B (Chido/Rodgers blood group) n=1 Tax=Fundulus heteroclitus TaxID=8078 RepID=A0A3Q2TB46_FUNHE